MVHDHNRIKLEISNRKMYGNSLNIWTLNNILLNNPCIKEKITWRIRNYFEVSRNENIIYIKHNGMNLKQCL